MHRLLAQSLASQPLGVSCTITVGLLRANTEHKAHPLAQDILQVCRQSSGPPSNLAERLQELESAAATLPGPITVVDQR
jgi:hypothetical protein